MWPGVIENNRLSKDKFWEVTRPDKTKYAEILMTQITGANSQVIRKQEWFTTNYVFEI